MKRLLLISSAALLVAAGAASGAAQDSVQTVKDLYGAAAYEDALAAVSRLQADRSQPEVEQYRVFSLTALGRNDEARRVMEQLLSADPLYVLDPVETPPRIQEAFAEIRGRLLPALTKQLYLEARAALDRKDRADAIARFETLLKIIDGAGAAAAPLGELRVLADGFLDLSRALPARPAPPASAAAVNAAAVPERDAVMAVPIDTRPIAIQQAMPPWWPTDPVTRRTAFSGVVRVHVGVDGRVESAELLRPIHPRYDQVLLKAARGWVYEPARRNDVPVAADLNVEVTLRPTQ